MEDSSFFMQWAMNTLDQHPSAAAAGARAYADGGGGDGEGAGAAAFPSLQALRSSAGVRDLTVQVDHRTSSWSSGDSPDAAMDHDGAAAATGWSPHTASARTAGGGGGSRPMSWNFSAASAQPTTDIALPAAAARGHRTTPAAGRRGGSVGPAAAAAAASSSPGPVQDHIMAERRRREKINQRFIELSTVIPGLKKMDKATILGDAVKYVRELQEKVKTLEDDESHHATSTIQSAVLVKKKPCLAGSFGDAAADDVGEPSESHGGLPEIEARFSEKSVLVRIHCENARGLLVRVLAEVEELRLAITHTSVMPFPAATAIITITAKVEEGFNSTVEEIVSRLNSALHQHYSGNS